ncbi:MAG: adenosylcobalamin-dependent ribonucleoside-diphosphate reductase [Candidatus Brocadia sp.]|uniref:Vitamin B12-dependent ribonucleotide reductase n=1 Tax=Candidatus Brocadia fulgida TaxID=380242 RepID=A0A0M2USX2_9BACT|nr:MAG: ribonucleoside-diphosphate reductase 1 alpha chain [Candidatus Brocadia fulgida]UJS22257.1 MAG: adenosylcobalamin-dependent ribonucleoside-diphosphate reductase [Candidatus Brocadia sp.]
MAEKITAGKPTVSLSSNARLVLEKRYLKKDISGRTVESPEEMFRRIAKNIASVDLLYDKGADIVSREEQFYTLLASLRFLPNSPTLMNAGRDLQQLFGCFVLPIEDSVESIFEAVKQAALIHKSGGGTGFSFSRIRPKNDTVSTSGGRASGPISFMKVFNEATEAINQGGFRRGANMAVLRIDHPDIRDFITAKRVEGVLTNFNISVGITDVFMQAVEKNEAFPLINPRTKAVATTVNARNLFEQIVHSAWENGEPGILFLDTINAANPTPALGEIEGTNPCGEQPLLPFEACVLGSVNLSRMTKRKGKTYEIDWDRLANTTRLAVHFLDNIIDINKYPLPQIEHLTKGNRKIGLGIMGLADLFIKLGISYNSEKAIQCTDEVMRFFSQNANDASVKLAEERGTFPNYQKSIYAARHAPHFRNATRTTIAPTGTISIIAHCSSGIEPVFAVAYTRHVLVEGGLPEIHPIFKHLAKTRGFYSERLMEEVSREGSLTNIHEIPEDVKKIFITAREVSPEHQVKIQATCQKYIDSGVSKTINFSKESTEDDVRNVFLLAYKNGCKGITVYRNKSRVSQVLSVECTCTKELIK